MSAGRAQPKLSKAQSFPLSAEQHGAALCWRLLITTLHPACPPPHDVRPAKANPREPTLCADHEDTDWSSGENGLVQRRSALVQRKTELLARSRSDVQALATKGC